jgi:hypothetical protein
LNAARAATRLSPCRGSAAAGPRAARVRRTGHATGPTSRGAARASRRAARRSTPARAAAGALCSAATGTGKDAFVCRGATRHSAAGVGCGTAVLAARPAPARGTARARHRNAHRGHPSGGGQADRGARGARPCIATGATGLTGARACARRAGLRA